MAVEYHCGKKCGKEFLVLYHTQLTFLGMEIATVMVRMLSDVSDSRLSVHNMIVTDEVRISTIYGSGTTRVV
jgi:hypothetical protein